jgi:hypothetical protein
MTDRLQTQFTLAQLRDNFQLVPTHDDRFFREWQDHLLELDSAAKQALDEGCLSRC